MFKQKQKAFTLIELLVVIAIIGILATLAVVALQQARSNARDSKRMADVKQIHTALELFYNENNRYPTQDEWDSGTIISSSSQETFMYSIPSAPTPADGNCASASNTYTYVPASDGSTYTIDFCTGKQVSDLPQGAKQMTPGGIVIGSSGNTGENGAGGGGNGGGGEEIPNVYTLTYLASTGGTIVGDSNQNINQGENGTEVTASANTGYLFSQWSDGITTASRTDLNIQSNIEVTAQFTANTYTLTFNPQSGTVSPASKSVTYNQEVGTLPTPTRDGYSFLEWNTQSNGGGITYTSNTVYNIDNNSTVYAVWEIIITDACNNETSITYEGKTYSIVSIGTQCWMAASLNVGTRISGGTDQTNNGMIEKYCYGNLESNCDILGGLYQWSEVMQYVTTEGAQGICPAGWHVPSDTEWTTLANHLGGVSLAGGKMKGIITCGSLPCWASPNAGATNESGFTGWPTGYLSVNGSFYDSTVYAAIWSSSEYSSVNSWYYYLTSNYSSLGRTYTNKPMSFSVRCLKD